MQKKIHMIADKPKRKEYQSIRVSKKEKELYAWLKRVKGVDMPIEITEIFVNHLYELKAKKDPNEEFEAWFSQNFPAA